MVQRDDLEGAGRRVGEHAGGVLDLGGSQGAALVLPGPHRVEAADDDVLRAVHGLELGPLALELVEGVRQPEGRPARDVVVSGDDEERPVERAQEARRALVLLALVPVGEIAGREDELRVDLGHQRAQVALDLGLLPRPGVEVRHLQHAKGWHRAGRL